MAAHKIAAMRLAPPIGEDPTSPVKNTSKSELQTAFAQDVEDADPALAPEDALAALIEAGSLVEILK